MNQIVELDLEEQRATIQPVSDIFIVKSTDGKDIGIELLIDLMGKHGLFFYISAIDGKNKGSKGLIAKDDVILIKVNCQHNERGGTNTDLLKSIIEAILSHPDGFAGEIIVADNGQAQYGAFGQGGSLNWEKNNAEDRSQSIQKVVDTFSNNHKISTYLWDNITLKKVNEYSEADIKDGYIIDQTANPVTGIIVSYPKFKTKFGTYVSFKNGIWDSEKKKYDSEKLKIINVPVLKTHHAYGVTACVKHYMGVVSEKQTKTHRYVGTGGMGTEMVETRMPTLNILDAIWINANPRRGPHTTYFEAMKVNVIMASVDPVALDYWAAKHVLMQAAQNMGFKDLSTIDPDNTASNSFRNWLMLSMREIEKAGYQATPNEDQMNIFVINLPTSI